MTTISIVGWQRFQHYKDRDPPWVKLYRDLLTSESWVLGTDHSRLVQIASILLAARYENKIPLRWDLIKKVASLDMTEAQFKAAIQHLVEHKFIEYQQLTNGSEVVGQSASTPLATCTSEAEQSRAEQRQSRDRSVELKLDAGPIERVFDHWRSEHKHPKSVLDRKRRAAIQTALKTHDEPTLCQAISGYRNSPHHMGENDQRTVYDDISLFLRDAKHIEAGLHFARGPPPDRESNYDKFMRNLNGNDDSRVIDHDAGFPAISRD